MEQQTTNYEGNINKVNSNFKSLTRHSHKFERVGDFFVCSCGKKRLYFDENKKGLRSNGKKYSQKADKNRFFFPKEYMKFEDNLKPKQKHTIKCLLNTGARIDELQHVRVEDFIFNPQGRSRIILRKTKTKAKKGEFGVGRVRDIPVSRQFARYLNNFIQENKLAKENTLNILTNGAINIFMKDVASKIGLINPQDFSAHSMRKTLEVWLMALGVDSLPLTAHIGHDIRTAASHYVSPDIFSWDDKKLIRQIIGDLYESHQ